MRRAGLILIFVAAGCSGEIVNADANGDVIFLAQNVAPSAVMEALFDGRVVRDAAGCLRLGSSEPATVIWPKDFVALTDGDDIHVEDAEGRTIGQVGGNFRFGGGFVDSLHIGIPLSATDRQRAAAACPGKYWIVGDVVRDR